jgi:hypothetical protein
MRTRTIEVTVSFSQPFLLTGIDRLLPAGDYRVVTDDLVLDGESFQAFRRVATMMMVPTRNRGSLEMIVIDPDELELALAAPADQSP